MSTERPGGKGPTKLIAQTQQLAQRLNLPDLDSPHHHPGDGPNAFGRADQSPSRPAKNASAGARAPRRNPRQPPAMIIVESQANEFMVLKRAFWKAGATARVWWAHDGEEALSVISTLEAAVSDLCVVVGTWNPATNPVALLAQIRAKERPCSVRFVIILQPDDKLHEDQARALGADAVFIKTSEQPKLLEMARALQAMVGRPGSPPATPPPVPATPVPS